MPGGYYVRSLEEVHTSTMRARYSEMATLLRFNRRHLRHTCRAAELGRVRSFCKSYVPWTSGLGGKATDESCQALNVRLTKPYQRPAHGADEDSRLT